jgi:Sel1 repeat
MTLPRRAAIPPLILALIVAILTTVHFAKARAHAHRLVEEAQALRIKADHGDAEAQAHLGTMHYRGDGVPQDFTEAARCYRQSAKQGNRLGEEALALCYHNGRGVPQSDAQALAWFRKSADQGYPKAENAMALIYDEGRGVPQDTPEALRWYHKAISDGDSAAEYNLGEMYYFGRGVPLNRKEGLRLIRDAAKQGDAYAIGSITLPFTPLRRFTLVVVFLFSLFMLTEFFCDWPAHANDPQRRRHDVLIAIAYALNVALTGVTWYGYTHHKILCIGRGMNSFTAIRWILDILVIAVLSTLWRKTKRLSSAQTPDPENLTPMTEAN